MTLVLLRGPSENVLPLSTIVAGIPNTGTYTWTPSLSLEADVTHYGLKLLVDGSDQFQYSTQFGISGATGPAPASPSPSATATVGPPVTQYPDGQPQAPTGAPAPPMPPAGPSGPIVVSMNATATTTYCPPGSTPSGSAVVPPPPPPAYTPSGGVVPPSAMNGTSYVAPTAGPTMATSLANAGATSTASGGFNAPTAPSAPLPLPTGAGTKVAGSLGLAGVGVVVALWAL